MLRYAITFLAMKLNGAKLVTARHRKGWNQTQLARKSGLTLTTISKAENGNAVYPDTAQRIWKALGLNPDDVVIASEEKQEKGDAA